MNKAIDASDLGLKPGEWPRTIEVEGHVYSRGQRMVARNDAGLESGPTEFAGYVYISDEGTITVFND